MSYILQTNHLCKTIDGKELAADVNIHVKKGEIYGFLGPNGAGKTTVMKMITNLWKPTDGTVLIFGRKLEPTSYEVLKRMGSIIEFPTFYEHMSGIENLRLHCEYMGYYNKGCIEEALEMLDLTDAGEKPVKRWSLGMKQRLGLAVALLGNPDFLILDEPINGLDPEGIHQMRELLLKLNRERNVTILLSSHILGELSRIATAYGIIREGELAEEFDAKELEVRCRRCQRLTVDNAERTAAVLEEQLHIREYDVPEASVIRIFEHLEDSVEINRRLTLAGIEIRESYLAGQDLESYFMSLMNDGKQERRGEGV